MTGPFAFPDPAGRTSGMFDPEAQTLQAPFRDSDFEREPAPTPLTAAGREQAIARAIAAGQRALVRKQIAQWRLAATGTAAASAELDSASAQVREAERLATALIAGRRAT